MQGDPLRAMTRAEFMKLLRSIRGFESGAKEDLYLVLPSINQSGPQRRRIQLEFVGDMKPLDSSHITPVEWADIASKVAEAELNPRFSGVVVLHGTDTLAWTASALSFLLGSLRVPIVMTGSQSPLGHSRTDALRNLITAIEFAATAKCPKEVCIFFDQVLLRGNRATKCRSSGFDGFETPNFAPLSTAGTILKFAEDMKPLPHVDRTPIQEWRQRLSKIRVLTLRAHPGLDTFPRIPSDHKRMAVILEAYGAGTANPAGGLRDFLFDVKRKHGAQIVLRTQVQNGTVESGLYEAAEWLKELVIPGSDITSEACLAKLYYLLGRDLPPEDVEKAMRASLRGEATLPQSRFKNGILGGAEAYESMAGRHHYYAPYTDEARLVDRLVEILAAVPGALVSKEVKAGPSRLDIVVYVRNRSTGIECTVGRCDSDRAMRDMARLAQGGLDQQVIIAARFTPQALRIIHGGGGHAFTWAEAVHMDWGKFLWKWKKKRATAE